MQAQPDPSDSLVFECDFDEPPEKVWRALTEPRLLEAWLTTEDAPQSPSGDREILTAEPHRLVRYRWRDRADGPDDSGGSEVHSVVTVELAPCPTGGTHLRLTHGEFTIVSAVPTVFSARVTPITGARRRRTPILSCAAPAAWRRAA